MKSAKERAALIEENAASINREALKRFVKLVTAYHTDDPERKRLRDASLFADLLGEAPVAVPRAPVDEMIIDLLHRFLELARVPENFAAIETMAKSYPWKGKISQSQHLGNCFILIGHEAYILEERLKCFLNSVSACTEDRNFGLDIKAVTKGLLKVHKQSFGGMVAARGAHVHQRTIVPREIERVALLELMEGMPPIFAYLRREAVRKARKQMIARAGNARLHAKVLVASAVQMTRTVWETVVQEQLKRAGATKTKRRKLRPK